MGVVGVMGRVGVEGGGVVDGGVVGGGGGDVFGGGGRGGGVLPGGLGCWLVWLGRAGHGGRGDLLRKRGGGLQGVPRSRERSTWAWPSWQLNFS